MNYILMGVCSGEQILCSGVQVILPTQVLDCDWDLVDVGQETIDSR